MQIGFKKLRMRKIYCTTCKKYKKIEKPKRYICDKTLLLSSICNKFRSDDERKIFKEKESIEMLKILYLITLKI